MAVGDDALAAGMPILTGNEPANTLDTEVNRTRDLLAQRTNEVTPVEQGGTGATTPAGARTALGVPAVSDLDAKVSYADTAAPGAATPNKLAAYDGGGRLATASPASGEDAVPLATLSAHIGVGATIPIYSAGGPATSGYTVAYINGDGRLSKGASSERYKTDITLIDPASLGDIFPDLYSYRMAGGHDTPRVGWIAERLAESPDLLPFVVYERITEYNATTDETTTRILLDDAGNPIPDSIDFISLLIAEVARLHQRVTELEAK